RVVRAIEDDHLGARPDGRAQPIGIEVEPRRLPRLDLHRHAADEPRLLRIRDPVRVRDQDLVAGVQDRDGYVDERVLGTARDDDGASVFRRSASTACGSFGGGPPGYLGGNFSASRFSTIVGTIPVTDVPKPATSLMRREEMYVYFSCGMRNTVSTVDRSLRFISAIWNSYSKSETARMPRTMQSARSRATRSISNPSNATMRKLLSPAVASSIISRRSLTVKSGCFEGFATTATISSSKIWRLRWMTSMWPLCTGSNMPG